MPRYEGNYSRLREHPFCNACGTEGKNTEGATTAALLKRCSRCNMVWYCSVACQKTDYAHHKRSCREIAALQADTDAAYELIESLFELDEEGNFPVVSEIEARRDALMTETNAYIRARMMLCLKQGYIAKKVETRDAWELILEHHQELLCLDGGFNCALELTIPFLMLRLSRDDEAYCCCRDRVLGVNCSESDLNFTPTTARSTSNPRFRDFMEDVGGEQVLDRWPDVSYVLVVAIIKMRLVAIYESLLEEVDAFAATTGGHTLGPDGPLELRQFLVGRAEAERQMADQRRQLTILLDAVQTRNPSMLPALLHPIPLMQLQTPTVLSAGTPLEARLVINLAWELYKDIPGSDRILQSRFGTATPWYPT